MLKKQQLDIVKVMEDGTYKLVPEVDFGKKILEPLEQKLEENKQALQKQQNKKKWLYTAGAALKAVDMVVHPIWAVADNVVKSCYKLDWDDRLDQFFRNIVIGTPSVFLTYIPYVIQNWSTWRYKKGRIDCEEASREWETFYCRKYYKKDQGKDYRLLWWAREGVNRLSLSRFVLDTVDYAEIQRVEEERAKLIEYRAEAIKVSEQKSGQYSDKVNDAANNLLDEVLAGIEKSSPEQQSYYVRGTICDITESAKANLFSEDELNVHGIMIMKLLADDGIIVDLMKHPDELDEINAMLDQLRTHSERLSSLYSNTDGEFVSPFKALPKNTQNTQKLQP